MAQLRLAVELGQLVGQVDEPLFRGRERIGPVGVVEGEHRERPVHGHRLGLLVVVEHHSARESAHPRHPRLGEHLLAPELDEARRDLGFGPGVPKREAVSQVQRRATGQKPKNQRQQGQPSGAPATLRAAGSAPWSSGRHSALVRTDRNPFYDECQRGQDNRQGDLVSFLVVAE